MPRGRPVAKQFDRPPSMQEMLKELAAGVKKQATAPNILGYVPHVQQIKFHKSENKIVLYIGGNRSGKTVAGVTEDIYRLKGEHPFKKVKEAPVHGRVVCVDWTYGIGQIIIPKFKQWMPPSLLIDGSWDRSYNKTEKVLTCTNGSTVEFMTYEQEVDTFAGTSRDFIHVDEEPPEPIYNECHARTIDVNGKMYLTMTPVLGMTWVHDKIYQPGLLQTDPRIEVVIVDITENPHLPQDAVKEYLDGLDPDERKARAHGEFVQIGGLVYKNFAKSTHVIDVIDPKKLPRGTVFYLSMDHGFNNPTAWLWHAVLPDSTVITFDEHYASELVVEQHAEIVKSKHPWILERATILGDPAIKQRSAVNGTSIQTEYAQRGIFIGEGNNDVITGVNKINSYLKINPNTGKPFWQITENCESLISELRKLRWKTYTSATARADNNKREEIHKKDDHACDSARYFFSIMPDLTPELITPAPQMPRNTEVERFDKVLARMSLEGTLNTIWTPESDQPSALEWE